ncbi:MAG: sulfite exporter TauE/SafE family protein [Clostridia bacterium]
MKKKEQHIKNIKLVITGLAIGVINGFFGGGGGMVCVPLLEKVLKIDNKSAHATSLAVMLPVSFVSALVYIINGNVDFRLFAFVAIGSSIGAIIGAKLLKKINKKAIRLIFSILMVVAGIMMVIR